MPRKRKKVEENVHTAICTYIKSQYPFVVFTSESSGIRVGIHIAAQMKRQRSKDKLPDLIVMEPRGGYFGLVIEIKKNPEEYKTKDGKLRSTEHLREQAKTLQKLHDMGYRATFGGGFDELKLIVDKYMKNERTNISV